MNHLTHIFVDMDGVLADFISSAFRAHGKEFDAATYPRCEWEICRVLGISEAEFWAKIDTDPDFWLNLNAYEWAHDLLAAVSEVCAQTRLLTTPSNHPNSYRGKREWLNKHAIRVMPILCASSKDKALLAGPGRLLIDDSDKNVELFRAAGGAAILFPQVWNKNHPFADDPLGHVLEQLGVVCA